MKQMKKIFLVMLIVAGSISCRKERTCECTTKTVIETTGSTTNHLEHTTSRKVTKDKQKKKEFIRASDCYSTKTTETYFGGSGAFTYTDVTTTEVNCDLK
jgi:hypothetical protein